MAQTESGAAAVVSQLGHLQKTQSNALAPCWGFLNAGGWDSLLF